MAEHVYDYDWQSVYPSIIKPMCGRGSGKSQARLQMYDAILKGENKMNVKETLNQIYGTFLSQIIAVKLLQKCQTKKEKLGQIIEHVQLMNS